MRFESITLAGFCSLSTVAQTLQLADRGLVLIEGENRDDPSAVSNGSGKSIIFEGLLWTAFGRTIRYGAKTADRILNIHAGRKNCMGKLYFTDDKGQTYRIERYRAHEEFKNKLFLFGPKGPMTFNDSSETQLKINSLLGMDYESFTSSVMFGQRVAQHFSGMTDKDQKSILDRIIGVEAISKAHKRARDKDKELNNKLNEIMARGAEEKVSSLRRELVEAKAEEKSWFKKHEALIASAEEELSKSVNKDGVLKAKALLKAAEDKHAESVEVRKASERVLSCCQADHTAFKRVAAEASKNVGLVNKEGGVCQHCGSKVTGDQLKEHLKGLEDALRKASRGVAVAQQGVQAAQDAWDAAETSESRTGNEVTRLRGALHALEVQMAVRTKVEETLAKLNEEKNPYGARVKSLGVSLEAAEGKAAKDALAFKEISNELKYLNFVLEMFSDKGSDGRPPLKGCLLDNVAPFLNEKAAYYSKYLTKGNIEISFQTQRELSSGDAKDEFRVVANNVYGAEDYAGGSGGEQQKIDVCVALALQALGASRVHSSVNIGLFDEIFESLDDASVDCVMDLLQEETKTRSSTFVITHLASLKAMFPSRILVVKEDGISTIVDGAS